MRFFEFVVVLCWDDLTVDVGSFVVAGNITWCLMSNGISEENGPSWVEGFRSSTIFTCMKWWVLSTIYCVDVNVLEYYCMTWLCMII